LEGQPVRVAPAAEQQPLSGEAFCHSHRLSFLHLLPPKVYH
jgi:hypothetical protein